MNEYNSIIFISVAMGTLARISLLRIDYRQYPSYPQSFLSHLVLGFVAASLGSVAIPAFMEKEFSAVTFLALATSQFREIRNMERQSLESIENTELVQRGKAYIEDIAKKFEGRNYAAFLTSFIVSSFLISIRKYIDSSTLLLLFGFIIGVIFILFLNNFMKTKTIEDIANVKEAKISFDGPLMVVEDVVIMNIGHEASKEIIKKSGLAVMIYPKDDNARATLANIGQRQAILHNLATQLGIRKDVDEPDFTPLARREPETGNIALVIIPMYHNIDSLIMSTERVPVLESSKRKPIQSKNKEG